MFSSLVYADGTESDLQEWPAESPRLYFPEHGEAVVVVGFYLWEIPGVDDGKRRLVTLPSPMCYSPWDRPYIEWGFD